MVQSRLYRKPADYLEPLSIQIKVVAGSPTINEISYNLWTPSGPFLRHAGGTALILHQLTAASTWWCGPRPRLGWVEMAVGLPEGPSYLGHSPSFFWLCCPLNDRRIIVSPSSDSSDMYTSTVQSGPPLLMLHSRPTLVSKPFFPLLPILYLLPLPLHHRPLLLAVLLRLLPPLPSQTLSGFFNGMLEVFEPGALNYFTFSRPILSTLSAPRNLISTHLSLSGFLDSLLCSAF